MDISKKWLVGVLFLVLISCSLTYFFIQRSQEKYRLALEATISAEFKKLGNAYQAQGHVIDYADLEKRVSAALGPQVMAEIGKTNGTLQSLTTAVGEVRGSVERLQVPPEGVKEKDGSFSTSLDQSRGGLPSLTTLKLQYDPKKEGLTGLTGLWDNHTEKFSMSYGEWRTGADGARAAVSLKREVYKDPSKTIKLGEEPIEIINADSFFSKDMIARVAPFPKYSIFLGGAVDSQTGKTNTSFYVEKHITRRFSITTGYVNRGYLLGGVYTFGNQ